MTDLITYLLKVALGLSLISIPYFLFLRNDPLLIVKRVYLVGGTLLAWVFPLIALSKPEFTSSLEPVFFIDPDVSIQGSALPIQSQNPGIHLDGWIFAGLLYLTGTLLLFLRNLSSYIRIRSKNKNRLPGNNNVHITNEDRVYTIFPKIFLPQKYAEDSSALDSILIHERAHISQLHFIDLLLSELTLLLTWFNPFSWLISRMIKENHEHLADRVVLQQGVNPAHYKALLLNHAMGGEVFRLGHQLNHSLTKKRFKMMKKIKAPKKGFLKYIIIVPVILGFTLIATAASAQKTKTIHGKVYLEEVGEVAVGASVVISESTIGTVVDLDGSFSLEVEGNPIITISFVGYRTVHKTVKEISVKPVIMEQNSIIFTLDNAKSGITLKEKSIVTIKTKGNSKEEPIYVVDGKVASTIENIDPDEIESISVIKDPDDPIYKKYKANSGLILITTKKGKAKQIKDSDEPVFYVVENNPSFRGSQSALKEYLEENVTNPVDKNGKNISGEVHVKFKVSHKGKIENVEIYKSSNKELNNAAMEVIEDMPDWSPGKQRGKPVSSNVIVPVRFNTNQE
jgi:TonB family protein